MYVILHTVNSKNPIKMFTAQHQPEHIYIILLLKMKLWTDTISSEFFILYSA
jgi:hypothetical protein